MGPGETGKHRGHVFDADPLGLGKIWEKAQPREVIRSLIVAKPADRPRADYVERAVYRGPLRLGARVAVVAIVVEIAPRGGNPAEDGGRGARRTKIADNPSRLIGANVAILEAEPPNADDRFAAVKNVGQAVGQVKVTCQVRPILLDGMQRGVAVRARNIVHYEEAAAVRLGGCSRVF